MKISNSFWSRMDVLMQSLLWELMRYIGKSVSSDLLASWMDSRNDRMCSYMTLNAHTHSLSSRSESLLSSLRMEWQKSKDSCPTDMSSSSWFESLSKTDTHSAALWLLKKKCELRIGPLVEVVWYGFRWNLPTLLWYLGEEVRILNSSTNHCRCLQRQSDGNVSLHVKYTWMKTLISSPPFC